MIIILKKGQIGGNTPEFIYKASITFIPKPRKENYLLMFLMNSQQNINKPSSTTCLKD